MLYFKSCPRCRGDVHVDEDSYVAYATKCLQCGFSRYMPSIEALKKVFGCVSTTAAAARRDVHQRKAV